MTGLETLILLPLSPKLEVSRDWCGFVVMAEKTQKKRAINLLPNRDDTVLNQFLSWALSIGRLLVIITETLALSVFLYRFSLDRQIVDLHDKIKNESIIVQNFKDDEIIYRNLQSKLLTVKTYDKTDDNVITILKDIVDLGRNKVTFNNIIATNGSVDIEAEGPSASSLSLFTQALKSDPEVQDVVITHVDNRTSSNVVTIGVTVLLKNTMKAPVPTGTEAK